MDSKKCTLINEKNGIRVSIIPATTTDQVKHGDGTLDTILKNKIGIDTNLNTTSKTHSGAINEINTTTGQTVQSINTIKNKIEELSDAENIYLNNGSSIEKAYTNLIKDEFTVDNLLSSDGTPILASDGSKINSAKLVGTKAANLLRNEYDPKIQDILNTIIKSTGFKVAASSAATTNATAENGSVYLNSLANGAVTDSHKIIGTGGTSVTSDANGNITINSANTASISGLMGNTAKGSATQPIYWNGKEWVNTTYTLGKSVPSDAKFTDTTYTLAGLMGNTAKGSATQPIYWNGSAFVNTTHTLGKSVPSDAKFTDTWRGIQNNLTSTSTTDSLSAAQGKVLNDKLGTQCTYSLSGTTLTITPK